MAVTPDQAPRISTDRPADISASIADLAASSDADLAFQSKCPQHASQVVRVHNANAASQTATFVDEKGRDIVVVLAAGETDYIRTPCRSVDSSGCGSDLSAIAYYWAGSGTKWNR